MARALPEWKGASDNSQPPPRVIVRLMEKQDKRCAKCGRLLRPKHFACDHIQALVNGGKNVESNLQLLCNSPCHSAKTRADVAEKSKAASVKKKHLGIKAKRKGFRGWRKMNGDIVWAKDERT